MANTKISLLNSLTKSTVDPLDVLPIVDTSASATKKIAISDLLQPLDNIFGIANASDPTKKALFSATGISTGTTRTYTLPDANTTLVGIDTAQILTNKTLTSPQLNFGSDAPGDLYQRNSSGVTVRIPIGTNLQILQSNGTQAVWVANPSATFGSTSVAGIYQKAATADITAGTTTGSTGALLVVGADAVGTAAANKIVQFTAAFKYPAADGSLITNISNPAIYKVVVATYTNAAGTQTIAHGLGVVPKFIKLTVTNGGSGFATTSSVGAYNGTTNSCVSFGGGNGSASTDNSNIIHLYGNSGVQVTAVATWDATNVTLTWTSGGAFVGSSTINILLEAYA